MYRLLVLLLVAIVAQAADTPHLSLAVKSLQSLRQDLTTMAGIFGPDSEADARFEEMIAETGLPLELIDQTLPLQAVIWVDPAELTSGNLSLRLPTTDFEGLRDAFEKEAFPLPGFKGMTRKGRYAEAWFQTSKEETGKQEHDAWEPEGLDDLQDTLELHVQLDQVLRDMGLAQLQMAKAIVSSMPPPRAELPPNLDWKVMNQMMDIYFNLVSKALQGMDSLTISLGMRDQVLHIEERIQPVDGSDLEGLLHSRGSIEGLSRYLDPGAAISFIGRVEGNSAISEKLKEINRLNMTMQGIEADDLLDEMFEIFLPGEFTVSISASDRLDIVGVNRFEKVDPSEIRANYERMVQKMASAFSGEDKPYRDIVLEKDIMEIDGTTVDRVAMTINWDAPTFRLVPDLHKETMRRFWNGDSIEFLIAFRGKEMFTATPAWMESLLRRDAEIPGFDPKPGTVLYLRLHSSRFAELVAFVADEQIRVNRHFPDHAVHVHVDMSGNFRLRLDIPIAVIRQFPVLFR